MYSGRPSSCAWIYLSAMFCSVARSHLPPPNCAAAGLAIARVAQQAPITAIIRLLTFISSFHPPFAAGSSGMLRPLPGMGSAAIFLLAARRQRVNVANSAILDPEDVSAGRPVGSAGTQQHRDGTLGLVDDDFAGDHLRAGGPGVAILAVAAALEPRAGRGDRNRDGITADTVEIGIGGGEQFVAGVALFGRDGAPAFLAGPVQGCLRVEQRVARLGDDGADLAKPVEAPGKPRSNNVGLGLQDHALDEHAAIAGVDQIEMPGEIRRLRDDAGGR